MVMRRSAFTFSQEDMGWEKIQRIGNLSSGRERRFSWMSRESSFEDALCAIKERRAVTMQALKRANGGNKLVVKRQTSSTPFARLKEKVNGFSRPVQGGSPGQGKKS